MKATKILAGMSAAALAASMLTMVSASASANYGALYTDSSSYTGNDEDTDKTYVQLQDNTTAWSEYNAADEVTFTVTAADGIDTTATQLGVMGFDSSWGGWAGSWQDEADYGTLTLTFSFQDILDANSWTDMSSIAGLTFQIQNQTSGDVTESAYTYTITVTEATTADSSSEDDSSSSEADTTDYSLPVTLDDTTDGGYGGDWGGEMFIDYNYLATATDGVKITLNYDLLDGYEYYLFAPVAANGWSKLYNSSSSTDKLSFDGVYDTDEGFDKETVGATFLQNDGYFVLDAETDTGTLTFTLTQAGVDYLLENVDNEYGGVIFQVYGVDITSAYVEAIEEVVECPCGCGCTSDTCDNWDSENGQCGCGCAEAVELTAYLQATSSGWYPGTWSSDETPTSVEIVGDGTYTIEWTPESEFTDLQNVFVVDIDEVYEGGDDGSIEDRELIYEDFNAVLDSVTVDGVEVSFDSSKILYGNIEDNTDNYRIEIYNQYGDTVADPGIDASTVAGATLEVTFTVSGLGTMSGNCTCNATDDSSSTADESSSEADEDSSTEAEDSSDEEEDDTSSVADSDEDEDDDTSTTSSTSSTASTTTSSDSNPATGAAALGGLGIVLAGAAIVASKRK